MAGMIMPQHEKAFRDLLVFDSIRGEHSTGVAIIDKDEESVVKVVGDPFELFNSAKYEAAMKPMHRCLIGHNRYATTGKVNKRNAHPFEVGDLIGAHNGTLTNNHMLHEGYKFEVDSEALYHHIYTKGLRDAINTAKGAWALVWWDSSTETINFLRNKERTLFMAWNKAADVVFWASEAWMLNVALSRNNIDFEPVVSLAEDQYLSIIVDENRKMSKPSMRAMAAPVFTPAITTHKALEKPAEKQQTGGVVTPITKTTTSFHIGRKNILLLGMVIERDSCGGRYLECYDASSPDIDFRLYQNSFVDIDSLVNEAFTSDVLQMCTRTEEGVYYKMSGAQVKTAPKPPKDEEGPYFVDAHNKLLTKKEWSDKYQSCSFCTGAVFPEDKGNRFTTSGDILCTHCATDPQIQALVTIL